MITDNQQDPYNLPERPLDPLEEPEKEEEEYDKHLDDEYGNRPLSPAEELREALREIAKSTDTANK